MADGLGTDHPVRWGILGAGRIAGRVGDDIARTDGNVVSAVAAREAGRAAGFAARYEGARSYGSYAELAADPDVDVVYIATTHPVHRDQALMCIEAGKPVLVEKPVCLNASDTRAVFEAAQKAQLFAMEAMWMRTNPIIRQAEQLVAEGAIGDIAGVRAALSLSLGFDPSHRMYDMDNGGGVLLDMGIYPVTFAWLFLGKPSAVSTIGTVSPTGSDTTVAMQWTNARGQDAQLWCSATVKAPDRGLIIGTAGWIETKGRFHNPFGLIVHTDDGDTEIDDPAVGLGNGYGPEITEVARCLRAGLLESPLIPHADTIEIMELLDEARSVLGVKYPNEREIA
ncbi:MAG TPA: Gfo/Idh/MocA family oxidoreductase [Jatrophihabitans sp.]|jgi:predicted dehydrogenase